MDVILNYITWDVDPEIITDPITIRYYGPLFAMGFILGYPIVKRIFKNEGLGDDKMDKMLMYTMIATIVGARLGHVLLYGPYWDHMEDGAMVEGYFSHPINILKVYEGGLASHGGAAGLLIAMWIFSRRVSKKPILWGLDRLVIGTALAGCFIRLGNLFNSEIAGKQTDVAWGFHFPRYVHPITNISDGNMEHHTEIIVRHPTQIYEAIAYLAIFFILYYMYWKKDAGRKLGLLFGTFLVLVFGVVRFMVEFVKEDQAALDTDSFLNKGQLFSLPLILIGIFFVWYGLKKGGDYQGEPLPEGADGSDQPPDDKTSEENSAST